MGESSLKFTSLSEFSFDLFWTPSGFRSVHFKVHIFRIIFLKGCVTSDRPSSIILMKRDRRTICH